MFAGRIAHSTGCYALISVFYLTLILLRLFQQHYCYNVTGQSQESEGSCKPARIKEVHSKLHSFQASLCTLTATHLTLIYVCTYIRLSVPLGCLIKQAGINIHTILNMWETPGIEPVTSDLTSVLFLPGFELGTSGSWGERITTTPPRHHIYIPVHYKKYFLVVIWSPMRLLVR